MDAACQSLDRASVPRNEAEDWARAGRQGPTRSGVRSALAQHGHPCGVFLADPGAERECFVAEMECFAAAAAGDVRWEVLPTLADP